MATAQIVPALLDSEAIDPPPDHHSKRLLDVLQAGRARVGAWLERDQL